MFKYYLYRFGQVLVSIVPLRIAYRIAVFLSDLKYLFSPRDRRAVKENLKVICGDHVDVRLMARNVFRNFGKYLVEFFCMHTFDEEFVRKHITFENQVYLDEALKRGKGIIVMTAHIGNWELGGLALGRSGYPLSAIALPHKEKAINEMFNKQRAEGGVTVVPAQTAIRRCIRILKKNGIVALLADRDFSATGVSMMSFGRETMIPRGVAMFAYRTGASILPMFLTRTNDDTNFTLSIEPPLEISESLYGESEEIFMRELMKQQVQVIENRIKKDPSEWLLFRRFWIDKNAGPERITST